MITLTVRLERKIGEDFEIREKQFELDWDFEAVIDELEFAFPELQGAEEGS